MNAPPILEFQFRQALFPVNVQIKNDLICIRYSIKYFEVPLDHLVFMYVDDDPSREMVELILCAKDPKGRVKRTRIFSDKNAEDFHALIAYLSSSLGTGHLRDIQREAAYEIMGAKDQTHIYVPIMISICLVFVGFMMHPSLLHGLEGEAVPSTIEQIYGHTLDTNHVVINQPHVDLNTAVFEPAIPTVKQPLESQWHPVFDRSVNRQSVQLVAHFYVRHGTPVEAPDQLKGLIRRAGLEQLPTYVRKSLTEQGIVVDKDAVYIDVSATPKDEFLFFWAVMCLLGGLGGAIIWSLHRRRIERAQYLARLEAKAAARPSPHR